MVGPRAHVRKMELFRWQGQNTQRQQRWNAVEREPVHCASIFTVNYGRVKYRVTMEVNAFQRVPGWATRRHVFLPPFSVKCLRSGALAPTSLVAGYL